MPEIVVIGAILAEHFATLLGKRVFLLERCKRIAAIMCDRCDAAGYPYPPVQSVHLPDRR